MGDLLKTYDAWVPGTLMVEFVEFGIWVRLTRIGGEGFMGMNTPQRCRASEHS